MPAPAGNRQVVWGDVYANQPGQVINSLDVHGRVIVTAPNVVISNSIVRGADGGSRYGLIDASAGAPGLLVVDTEIAASSPNIWVNGVMGSNFELRRVSIWNVVDQVHITGDNVTVADSRLWGNAHWASDPNQGGGATHDDNIQIQRGRNITIVGNTLSGSHNAAVQVTQDMGAVGSLRIAGNSIDDGGCSVNLSEGGRGAMSGISVVDNVFGRGMQWGGCAIIVNGSTGVNASGNRYTDGASAGVNRG